MSILTPGRVWAIGGCVAAGDAKIELCTDHFRHERREREEKHAFVLVRVGCDELAVALDKAELMALQQAVRDALAWVRKP